jgi:GT2 family glycosyltransferase
MTRISGYVPCFNNAATIVAAARSLQAQSRALLEVFVVDDGSTDDSVARAEDAGLRVVRLGANLGRGAARARACREAAGDWIVSCDATLVMASDFVERTAPHLETGGHAAVIGRVVDPNPQGLSRRWRARHLLQLDRPQQARPTNLLSTWGVVMRADAVADAGGFDERLRHSEDNELGVRLLKKGWKLFYEPNATLVPQNTNTLPQLLERYWRWNVGKDEALSARRYFGQMVYSARSMARRDLQAGDPGAALLSLLTPHYFLWRKLRGKK